MHRSVLQNKGYGKFAAKNTVEVITMEELDVAVAKESRHIRTYKAKDPWGESQEYLVEFPGLTLDELRDLSNSAAINYMQGNRIPYTAIVDPHTLEEMEGLKGTLSVKQLTEAIAKHRAALVEKHGAGVERKLWEKVGRSLVQVDIHLGKGEIGKAMEIYRAMDKETARKPEALRERVAGALEVILDDAGQRLDRIEAEIAEGKGGKAKGELRKLAGALEDTPLEKRVDQLLKKI